MLVVFSPIFVVDKKIISELFYSWFSWNERDVDRLDLPRSKGDWDMTQSKLCFQDLNIGQNTSTWLEDWSLDDLKTGCSNS